MRNISTTIVTAATADSGVTSPKVDALSVFAASFSVTTTGDIAGAVKVQASNDPLVGIADSFTPTHWADIPNATATVSEAGTILVAKFDCSYRWLRVTLSGV